MASIYFISCVWQFFYSVQSYSNVAHVFWNFKVFHFYVCPIKSSEALPLFLRYNILFHLVQRQMWHASVRLLCVRTFVAPHQYILFNITHMIIMNGRNGTFEYILCFHQAISNSMHHYWYVRQVKKSVFDTCDYENATQSAVFFSYWNT